jgi:hypothetical protein
MRQLKFLIPLTALFLGLLFTAAPAAESTFSMSDKGGKMVSWKVTTDSSGNGRIFSVYDPATREYHPVTDPAERQDLEVRTDRIERKNAEMLAEMRLTPEQRDQKHRDEMIALATQSTPAPAPSNFRIVIDIMRGLLGLITIGLAIYLWVFRLIRRKG